MGINNWHCYNDHHCVGNWFDCWLFSTSWTCIHDIQKRKQKWYIYIPLYCFMHWCFLYLFHNFVQSQLCTGENRIFSLRTRINVCLHQNDTSMSLWLYLLMQSEVADFITIYRNKYELKFLQLSEAYSEPSLISKIELSAKIVNGFQIYIMKLMQ